MRAVFSVVLLLAVLAVCVSAVSVPYKSCGSSTDDATLTSIVSNEFPPVKGDNLSLNVTGNLTKNVTAGQYTIAITVGGFPLPDLTGDISSFRALPWPVGELNFTYSQDIPSAAPSGSYVVKISAVDQDSDQIFCISIAFSLKAQAAGDDSLPPLQQQPGTIAQLLPHRPIMRRQPIIRNDLHRLTPLNKQGKGTRRL